MGSVCRKSKLSAEQAPGSVSRLLPAHGARGAGGERPLPARTDHSQALSGACSVLFHPAPPGRSRCSLQPQNQRRGRAAASPGGPSGAARGSQASPARLQREPGAPGSCHGQAKSRSSFPVTGGCPPSAAAQGAATRRLPRGDAPAAAAAGGGGSGRGSGPAPRRQGSPRPRPRPRGGGRRAGPGRGFSGPGRSGGESLGSPQPRSDGSCRRRAAVPAAGARPAPAWPGCRQGAPLAAPRPSPATRPAPR